MPAANFTQKLVELSTSGEVSPLAKTWNCCAPLASSNPYVPAWAAPAITVADPFPSRPLQAAIVPDSKPSEKTTFEYAGLGVMAAEGSESEPVPAALIAATLNVYAVPFVRPVIV